MKRQMTFAAFATAIAVAASSAGAATSAMTTDALNLRNGPGPGYAVLSTLPANSSVSIIGCIDGTLWCQVDAMGNTGFVYAEYLTTGSSDAPVLVGNNWKTLGMGVVTHDNNGATVIPADASGVLTGRDAFALGDPSNTQLEPTMEWKDYVTKNPVNNVYIDGEMMVGVGVPETVTLYEVPGSDMAYVHINDRVAMVDRTNRRVKFVYAPTPR